MVGRAFLSPMKRLWTATKLVAIATLVGILATAPVGAFEVLPDKNLTGGSVRTGDRLAACGHAIGSQPSSRGSADYFTGAVRLDPLFQAPDPALVGGGNVTFEPGARTAWHTHP